MPPLLLPDPAAKETDRLLAKLEERIQKEYKQALKEAEKKWTDYLAAFDAQDKLEAAKLANGEITEQEYQAWRIRHIAQGKQWEEMRNAIAQDYHNRNLIASKLANNTMPDVYAVNANYGTYLIEHGGKIDTGFTLYNHDSAESLLKEEWSINPKTGRNSFLPPPKPGGKRALELDGLRTTNPDLLWNAKNIQSAMTQGILSGESMTKLAQRLAGVAQMDRNQAIRNARTLTTNVQSKGRMDSFDRATNLGVQLVDEWNAILDGKTRHSHRHMHGERKDHDSEEPFSNGCRWPGDPWGPPEEIYNCRCRIISWVKGFEGDTVKHNEAMGDMSFEEWQEEKAPKHPDSNLTSDSNNGNMSSEQEGVLRTTADPMREVFGSAEESNPDELKAIQDELARAGVPVERRSGAIAYEPSITIGKPGKMLIEPDASFAAWLHEFQHYTDDRDDGLIGYRIFADPERCAQRERRAYQVEIDMAKKAGREDIVKRLEELRDAEVRKYVRTD